jgi:EAL and modified HD-GYP domain-containing signal transduction protein
VSKSIQIEPSEASSLRPVVLRKPICDRLLRTFAYEILVREFDTEKCVVGADNEATSGIVFNSIVAVGLGRLVGQSKAFINFPREFILSRNCSLLPRSRVVLEILEKSSPDPKFLGGLAMLRMKGFRFALDNFNFQDQLLPFLPYCSFIKMDIRLVNRDHLKRELHSLRKFTASLLAKNVETVEELEFCRELGFQYFEGYFFCEPRVASAPPASTKRLELCSLLSRLQQPDVRTSEIEAIMSEDPTLSNTLQRCINSAAMGMPRKIQSIPHAIRMVGLEHIRILSSLVIMSSLDDKPRELTRTSVIRARMCQILGEVASRQYGSFFTTGLFSTLEAYLDCSMEKALEQIPMSDEIRAALLDKKGPKGRMLAAVIAYEQGDWDTLIQMRIDPEKVAKAYLDSVAWGDELLH